MISGHCKSAPSLSKWQGADAMALSTKKQQMFPFCAFFFKSGRKSSDLQRFVALGKLVFTLNHPTWFLTQVSCSSEAWGTLGFSSVGSKPPLLIISSVCPLLCYKQRCPVQGMVPHLSLTVYQTPLSCTNSWLVALLSRRKAKLRHFSAASHLVLFAKLSIDVIY